MNGSNWTADALAAEVTYRRGRLRETSAGARTVPITARAARLLSRDGKRRAERTRESG